MVEWTVKSRTTCASDVFFEISYCTDFVGGRRSVSFSVDLADLLFQRGECVEKPPATLRTRGQRS